MPQSKEPYFDEGKFFHHPCCITDCAHEGCFGEGVNLLKRRLGIWYCAPHYRELEHKRKQEKSAIKPASPQEKQGRLF